MWETTAQTLGLSNEIRQPLPQTNFKWTHFPVAAQSAAAEEEGMLPLPVYLNANRRELLFNVELKAPAEVPMSVWDRRSTAVVAWEQSATGTVAAE